MSFVNRSDAGRRLASALMHYRAERPIVLALPRGGVLVAAEVATAIEAPLDLLLVRKIGVPRHRELAMGAIADCGTPVTVRNEDVLAMTGVTDDAFAAARQRELAELDRRRQAYVGNQPPLDVAGRTVIVIDDGVATGATTRAALRAVRARSPAKLVLAVPVAPITTVAELGSECDEVVCLESYEDFSAIGAHYADFHQVGDRELKDVLDRLQVNRAQITQDSARAHVSGRLRPLDPTAQ